MMWSSRSFALGACLALGAALLLAAAPDASAQASPTQFTYQGRLAQGATSVNDTADLTFSLFDAADGGNLLAGPLSLSAVAVSHGVFTVQLDFGVPVAGIGERWIEIAAAAPSGGKPQTLLPRQPVTPAPASTVAFAMPVFTSSAGLPVVPFEGAVRFNRDARDFQGYNGLFWTSLTGKGNTAFAQQSYYNNGSYQFIVPAGVTRLFIETWGGGGGGGGCVTSFPNCTSHQAPTSGGSGGSGGYAASIITVTPGDILTLNVGKGGALGTSSVVQGFAGASGADSTVVSAGGTILQATGGEGGGGGIYTNMVLGDCPVVTLPSVTVALGGGASGVGSLGNFANSAQVDPIAAIRGSQCLGCCSSGLILFVQGPVASAFAAAGVPGVAAVTANFFGAGGLGASGPYANASTCSSTVTPALRGADGAVRVYWSTLP